MKTVNTLEYLLGDFILRITKAFPWGSSAFEIKDDILYIHWQGYIKKVEKGFRFTVYIPFSSFLELDIPMDEFVDYWIDYFKGEMKKKLSINLEE